MMWMGILVNYNENKLPPKQSLKGLHRTGAGRLCPFWQNQAHTLLSMAHKLRVFLYIFKSLEKVKRIIFHDMLKVCEMQISAPKRKVYGRQPLSPIHVHSHMLLNTLSNGFMLQ